MEKIKVVKEIPGLLSVGETLISSVPGADFILEESMFINDISKSSRFVSLGYTTVSENIPEFFVFEDTEPLAISDGFNTYYDCELPIKIAKDKTQSEVIDRYVFFQQNYENAIPGSEQEVVYKNLMWFIEWMYGYKELV